jgi:hypothetical protein
MGAAKIYDADRVTLVLGGITIDSGLADGEFFKIEPTTEAFTTVVGTDGEVARSKTNDRRVKGTIRVLQTSAGNAALSALHNLDMETSNGAGVVPLMLKDNNSTATIIEAEQCWISKNPSVTFSRGAEVREWPFEAASAKFFLTGS